MAYLVDPLAVLFADVEGKSEARRAADPDLFHEIKAEVVRFALHELEGVILLFRWQDRDEDARTGLLVSQLDASDCDERVAVRFAHEVFSRDFADVFGQSIVFLCIHVKDC